MQSDRKEGEYRSESKRWGDCNSSCWQSSILLSQDLNHPHVNTSRLGGFIQDVFLSYIFLLLNPFALLSFCCCCFSLTFYISVVSLWTPTHRLSTLLYFYVSLSFFLCQCHCRVQSNEMIRLAVRRRSLALHKPGSKRSRGRESADSDLSYVQTGLLQKRSRWLTSESLGQREVIVHSSRVQWLITHRLRLFLYLSVCRSSTSLS